MKNSNIKQTIVNLLIETATCSGAQSQRNLKRANEILVDNDMSWSMLFNSNSISTRPLPRREGEEGYNHEQAERMFEALAEALLPESTRSFIEDLYRGFEIYEQLTPKQYEALQRNYKKFV